MRPGRENPLTPASLATDGIQGAGANTLASTYGVEHSPQGTAAQIPTLTGDRCRCGSCGLTFMADDGFDFHRVGEYATPGQLKGDRRCLSLAELGARGWGPNELNLVFKRPAQYGPHRSEGPRVPPTATPVPGV